MSAYDGLQVCFGDLHNHCGISYGHGSLEEAFANAREQLDFCSITGHALWPDMPPPDAEIAPIIEFHERGFARLRQQWSRVQRITEAQNEEGRFVSFLGFEMHHGADGDHTILYRNGGDILKVTGLDDLRRRLRALASQGATALAFPHHLAYRRGQRGVNWDRFREEFMPVVEIISMHGCSETDENPRPFLHSMGGADHESTMQHGLARGHFFGVIGSTDHHSAFPGSYGHGRAGLWAKAMTRASLWEAIHARRTYALTGDRIELRFSLNGAPMGSRLPFTKSREIEIRVAAGGALDYVDVVKNGRLARRFSETDVPQTRPVNTVFTKLFLELGWGTRNKAAAWDVRFGISAGRIVRIEPRFRGPEVVSPLDQEDGATGNYHNSHWETDGARVVRFQTTTWGNPNNVTNANQGICLHAELPPDSAVWAEFNSRRVDVPLARLLEGAWTGNLGKIDSPGYRFHRAPLPWEFDWQLRWSDHVRTPSARDVYYLRVRQKNDQWAWSSPIAVG